METGKKQSRIGTILLIATAVFTAALLFTAYYAGYKELQERKGCLHAGMVLAVEGEYQRALDMTEALAFSSYENIREESPDLTAQLNDLRLYCEGMLAASRGDDETAVPDLKKVHFYFLGQDCITAEYSEEELGSLQVQVTAYLSDQKQKEQQEMLNQVAAQEKPYKGLSEAYIGYTQLGAYDETETRWEYFNVYDHESRETKMKSLQVNVYFWTNPQQEVICVAKCHEGIVISVCEDDSSYEAEIAAMKQRASAAAKKAKDDPYGADGYTDAEDFYYDHEDDFWDYEDAEAYYNAHSR